ncbi:molybdopterin synthase catalytic subunit MoaE [Gilvimarinus sp. F26214L]|uniref:molybdopterin synthase catalytic subunit MoaE n=1 Tax=Gilvimarinus sp. DZF01 TaxID=3461371 RepID=UPI0040465E8D
MVRIQNNSFDPGAEHHALRRASSSPGAIVTFTGLVRDFSGDQPITAMELEHYPGMTEKSLEAIIEEARTRWPLDQAMVIHRVGRLLPDEEIVWVGVSSAHRRAAFAACEFIMDFLKTRAPFWKKEFGPKGAHWVDAKESDEAAATRWSR